MGLLESVKSINWELESPPVYQDFRVLPLFVVFFPSFRFLLDRLVFEKLAKHLIYGRKQRQIMGDNDATERNKKIIKFKESAWKCVYYLSAEIFALYVTYNEPWFKNTKYFWVGPGDQAWPDQPIKLKLKLFNMFVVGFYTYSIFALIFWETRRSDFGVSMAHHIVTLILIVIAHLCSFSRAGSVILPLHDASDVFLEVGKMSKYSGAEGIASFSFILFALSWIILRLIYYPFWILWSTRFVFIDISLYFECFPLYMIYIFCCSYEVLLELDTLSFEGSVCYYICNTLLYSLLVLHIYWWVLIYRMLVKQIQARGKLSQDVRSDSEGEDEHQD
ncbi:unnamed protein product [Thlaspi arvense]|uniref:TLC domain-containing protein n=1 Tax=Thlaspi arvense TaxID=13288 RepID=A0AAU9RBP8_THLAR|nr:unnamed protein product [Thlaspi arvense]